MCLDVWWTSAGRHTPSVLRAGNTSAISAETPVTTCCSVLYASRVTQRRHGNCVYVQEV